MSDQSSYEVKESLLRVMFRFNGKLEQILIIITKTLKIGKSIVQYQNILVVSRVSNVPRCHLHNL